MPRSFRGGKPAAFALLAALALSSCSIVPRSTMDALHAFDLASVSAGELRLAVRVPDGFVLDGGAPAVSVTAALNGGAPTTRRFEMIEIAAPPALASEMRAGSSIHVYALDTASVSDLDAYLASVRANATPGSRQLALGMSIEGCRTDGSTGRLPVTTFIQLAPSQPFLVLTRPRDLASLAALAGREAEVPAC